MGVVADIIAENMAAAYGDTLPSRVCPSCEVDFTPKPRGYNAVYCSKKCKVRVKYRREKGTPVIKNARKRHWQRIKVDLSRLEKHQQQNIQTLKKVRQWLAAYKLERGCVDCGFKAHWTALQLDHEGPKTIAISAARSSVKRLKEEIEAGRCVVRCANCHSIKTWERKQNV